MNYQKIYDDLIAKAQERNGSLSRYMLKKTLHYVERHHIIPKCLGGLDTSDNFVFLTAREHFIAHILLIKIFPDSFKLRLAVKFLMYDKQGNKLNGKSYEWLKNSITAFLKTQNKHNNEGIAKQAEAITGRTKESHEYLQVLADKRTGLTKENCQFIASMAETLTGRSKENHSGVLAQSIAMTGRTAETHEGIALMVEKKNKLTKEQRVILVQMREVDNLSLKDIHYYFVGLGIKIAYSTIHQIYHREKNK